MAVRSVFISDVIGRTFTAEDGGTKTYYSMLQLLNVPNHILFDEYFTLVLVESPQIKERADSYILEDIKQYNLGGGICETMADLIIMIDRYKKEFNMKTYTEPERNVLFDSLMERVRANNQYMEEVAE